MEISRRRVLQGMGVGAVSTIGMLGWAERPAHYGPAETVGTATTIHLDRNENPYGPPDSAVRAMQESLTTQNLYPDGSEDLRKKIAEYHKVAAEQVVLGCGSTEVLRMAADAFLAPGKTLVLAVPTCPILASFARAKGIELFEVPLTRDYAHDLAAMLARCDNSAGLIYICNPNNPTGTLTPRSDLEDFLHKLPANIPVLIDEAYHHYVIPSPSYSSFLDQKISDKRTIVTRTFSKIYGLAGVRLGYAVAPASVAKQISEFSLPFGENAAGIAAAMAALDDSEHVRRAAQQNLNDRQSFFNSADVRYVRVVDSQANFALLKLDHPIDEVIAHFRSNRVFVGPRFPQLDGFLRVSIGNAEENKAFWRVWDMLPHKPVHGMSKDGHHA